MCPFHAGILKAEDHKPSEAELNYKNRFAHLEAQCNHMTDDQLREHILGLEALLEDVKIRQQAANHVRTKRVRELMGKGVLSDAQKQELEMLRDPKMRGKLAASPLGSPIAKEPKLSKEEKEIQKYMKQGFTREKAIKLLGLDE